MKTFPAGLPTHQAAGPVAGEVAAELTHEDVTRTDLFVREFLPAR